MMSTKEQELKTLEKIRKIVEDLGEESYIGTAFEGCFEIAEENIENDFACSMKNRWETERKDAEHFRRLAGKLTDELEKAKKENERLRKKVLPAEDMNRLHAITCQKRISEKENMNKAAAKIVENAENPNSKDFRDAVEEHRNAKKLEEIYQGIAERLTVSLEA